MSHLTATKDSIMASTLLLLLVVTVGVAMTTGQHPAMPCSFNAMCSCKLTLSPPVMNSSRGTQHGRFPHLDEHLHHPEMETDESDDADHSQPADDANDDHVVRDVSCVGVPLAALPALPRGRITHVDIVSSGLVVADTTGPAWKASDRNGARVESLRLMSNKIRYVGDETFRSMAQDLRSLDLSYNELDELPVRALQTLRVLDWANFHSNRLASLEGTGQLWSHLSSSLNALFLGSNDITALPRSLHRPTDESGEHGGSNDDSLLPLRHLTWLNLDGNLLSEIPGRSLPSRLHTLSIAHNRLDSIPVEAIDSLRELRWLDLRGNHIEQLPTGSLRSSSKLRLDKLDLGENLIWHIPEEGLLFNRSAHIRDFHLDFNRITKLPSSAFRGTSVARLYLASNNIQQIDEKAFHSLSSSLVLLDLDRNKIAQYPTALDHLRKLRFLYLSDNLLAHLPPEALASFGSTLEALNLAGNRFKEFPAAALRNSPQLVHLNLGYNSITSIRSEHLNKWASNLEALILRGNHIGRLPPRLFQHAPKLRELSLSFNKISEWHESSLVDVGRSLETLEMNMALSKGEFPVELLKPLRRLQWLSLEYNHLQSLPDYERDFLAELRFLSLQGNRLSTINEKFFKADKLRQLRDVRLAHNVLETLRPGTFYNLPEITSINLAHNQIRTVHGMVFDNLPKLITITLVQNRIERLDPQAFRLLPNLLKLELQQNRLKEFSWDAFDNCTNSFMAMSINISHNDIVLLQPYTASETLIHLKSIDLSHNRLAEFPTVFFWNVAAESLKKLYLSHNRINKLSEACLSKKFRQLQVLDLHHNHLETIEKNAFDGADNVQIVDLSHNHLESLVAGLFSNMSKLRIVNLAHNRLRSLPRDLLENSAIDSLDLSHNHLSVLPVGSLALVASTLTHLDVSYNHIDHLDAVVLAEIPNLVSLNLAHNRLNLLPDNVFSHLSSLMALDLSFNSIRANFKELFYYMQKVKELHLAGVGLTKWPHLLLSNLITLNLSSNALDYHGADHAPSHFNVRLDRLRNLDLSRNHFTAVPSFLWPHTPLLKQIDLSSNPVRILNRDSFNSLNRLQVLKLQSLPVLEAIEADSFHSLFYLNTLYIQTWPGPHLSQLLTGLHGLKRLVVDVRGPVLGSQLNNVATLGVCPKLRDLEITGTQLRTLESELVRGVGFQSLPECSFSLKHTSLKYISDGFLSGLEACASLTLDLQGNSLHGLAPQSFSSNISQSANSGRHIAGLHLDNNPWLCSCENVWMGPWLKQWYLENLASRHLSMPWPLAGAICTDPISPRQRHLSELSPNESSCNVAALSAGSKPVLAPDSRITALATVLFTLVLW